MTDVLSEAGRYDLPVVEDAAESFGCVQRGKKVGTFGAAGAFSFFANKVITTGEGGCVATNDSELFQRAKHFSNLCTGRNYWHDGVGCNFRMAALPAALGMAQLAEVDRIIRRKREIARFYRATLLAEPVEPAGVEVSSEWMPVFRLPDGLDYERLRELCERGGVQTRPTFQPTHLMPGLEGLNPFGCPRAERLRGFILPCYPALTNSDLNTICGVVNAALGEFDDGGPIRDRGDDPGFVRGGVVSGVGA
jgi:perosamine synthetase